MNSTIVIFTDVQKGLLPVVMLPCAILCFIFYKFVKRRLAQGETMSQRLSYLYIMVSAVLLGHTMFKIFPNIIRPYFAVVGFGFFIAMCITKLACVLRDNKYEEHHQTDLYDIVDRDNVQIKEDMEDNGLEDFGENASTLHSQWTELRQRRVIAILLILVFIVMSILDGLFFAEYGRGDAIMVVMFWISKLQQTSIVCMAMASAYFHGIEDGRWPWYIIISIVWTLVCGLSTLPALLDYSLITEELPSVMVFYTFGAGILLWLSLYYINFINENTTNLKRICIDFGIFFGTMSTTWVVSFFI